jgi:hypothetical protein
VKNLLCLFFVDLGLFDFLVGLSKENKIIFKSIKTLYKVLQKYTAKLLE